MSGTVQYPAVNVVKEQEMLLGSSARPVNVCIQKEPVSLFWRILRAVQIIAGIVFMLVFIGALLGTFGGAGSGSSSFLSDPKGHRTLLSPTVRFRDVHGCDEVKAQLEQIVDYLRNPAKYTRFGAATPRGFLLEGPPGVGKTMLAKAVAGEANVPFLDTSGAEFEEMFVGVGAARVRALFKEARSHGRAIIFIDEIDAMAGKRTALDRSNTRQTLNQLLVEMDGFRGDSGVIVLAATNSVKTIDEALLRPGRFDKTLTLTLPDINGRTGILKSLLATIPPDRIEPEIDAHSLAASTIGFSGADLTQLVNQAKLFATLDPAAKRITMKHFFRAKDFVHLGPEKALVMTQKDKQRTAYHEAGHAITALATPGAHPVHRATIVPHANALGLVLIGPDTDRLSMTQQEMLASVDIALAGFLAEETIYGAMDVSTGPSSDLNAVNSIVRNMVLAGFGRRTRFMQPHSSSQPASEAAKEAVEQDMQDILDESRVRVLALLQTHEAAWKAIAEALLSQETLTRQELKDIFAKHSGGEVSRNTLKHAKTTRPSKTVIAGSNESDEPKTTKRKPQVASSANSP